ncbi:LPS-assembly lipoprotein LptE [Bordetella sp. 02P26C-1]|uniref:LPS-assembly lipoprotein LptE n=1 Tax=Bordetella sp. 02P26C-1 TaxID=2683195 RepID=UPI001352FE45|nr:LPS assembly lipoprotein LptE [Bordetella sp. 02P26C-1]MVW80225.1 hypothetical protein [Bordetella sp. 02P26C-1]
MQNAAFRLHHLRSRWWLRATALAAVMLLAACGFALRGVTPLPFKTLYVGAPDNTRFGAELRRAIRAASPDTRLVDKPTDGEAILQVIGNERSLREVSLTAQGRVEEYELGIDFSFRLITNKGATILPDTTLSVYRDMPYDDQFVQAKEVQMETLYQSMQQSLVGRVVRRITAPEVKASYEAIQRGEDNPDAPVYDPNVEIKDDRPDSWRTPGSPGTGSW